MFSLVIASSFDGSDRPHTLSSYIRKVISYLSVDYRPSSNLDSLLSSGSFQPNHCAVQHEHSHYNSTAVTSILVLGDSVDRFMVCDFCETNPKYKLSAHWANITYWINPASFCCVSTDFIFCMANIYGSPPKGPYAFQFTNNDTIDSNVDTQLRIPVIMNDFIDKFGHPQFVLFRTDIWDLCSYTEKDFKVFAANESIQQFIADTQNAFKIIHKMAPKALLGTHTVPKITWGLEYFYAFLNAMKYLSENVSVAIQPFIYLCTYIYTRVCIYVYVHWCMLIGWGIPCGFQPAAGTQGGQPQLISERHPPPELRILFIIRPPAHLPVQALEMYLLGIGIIDLIIFPVNTCFSNS